MTAPVQVRPQWPFVVRASSALDRGFICMGWLKSFRESQLSQQKVLGDYEVRARAAGLPALPGYAVGSLPAELALPLYNEGQTRLIDAILDRHGVVVSIAHNPEQPDHLYGFLATEHAGPELVIHYLYVKGFYRKGGIATALLAEAAGGGAQRISHSQETGHPAARKLIRRLRSTYNPYKGWFA